MDITIFGGHAVRRFSADQESWFSAKDFLNSLEIEGDPDKVLAIVPEQFKCRKDGELFISYDATIFFAGVLAHMAALEDTLCTQEGLAEGQTDYIV